MISPLTLAGAAFVLYAGASTMWSPSPPMGIAWLGSLVLAFGLGARLPIRAVWYVFVFLVLVFIPVQPWLSFGVNQNAVGCAIVLALAAALVYEIWIFFPFAAAGLWMTQSRGALFAAGATCAVALWRRFPAMAWCLFVISIVAGSFVWQSKINVNVAENVAQRLGIWQDTINHLTVFGSGLGSFGDAYASWPVHRNMTGMSTGHAYNDFLELLFEFGIGVIPLWILVALCLELSVPIRLMVVAYFFLSLTFFPLYIPILGHLVAMTLGKLAHERNRYGSVETKRQALPQRTWKQVGV